MGIQRILQYICHNYHLRCFVYNNNGQFSTSTYRKPTFTGLGLHYLSFVPPIYKLNSIKTLLTRAYNVCSSWKAFHTEIVFLNDYFLCNGYPSKLVDKTINTFLNLKLAPPSPVTTVNKDVRYFKLPYMGKLSFEVRKLSCVKSTLQSRAEGNKVQKGQLPLLLF